MKYRRILPLAVLAAGTLAACADQTPTDVTPVDARASASASAEDRWIVVFDAGVADAPGLARRLVVSHGGTLRYTYEHAIKGFAAELPSAAVDALRRNPLVAYVEADQPMYAIATQNNATWGLDRIDQRALPLSGTYSYDVTGSGVTAYIIDTGIRYTHVDFGTRASFGHDSFGGNGSDCNGHGTHVAGTVGGTTWGVAKAVSLVAVRVLDCQGNGTTSGVVAGIDWVTGHHAAGAPAVANMSLGGGASTALDDAVRRSIADGVSYAVAAGNGDFIGRAQNACNYSPARVAEAMTIGATSSTDAKASWSNYGSCVDWFAPGVSITSAWYNSNTATNTISGTSMATPHVAGVAALYLQSNPGASPLTVRNALYDATTKGIVTSSNTTNNHLLYSLLGGGTTPPPNVAPVASFTYNCTELACTFSSTSTDSDGTIQAWAWNFGDGSTSTSANPSHTYGAGGIYNVTLRVTDDDGASNQASQSVQVSASSGGGTGFTLSASGYKVKGVQHADLEWSGATTSVDVYRDGAKVATATANDGAHTDVIGNKGGGSYLYRVCEAGTSTCSNEVTVSF